MPTPDALKNSLLALKENIIKRLILFLDVVVREINKRKLMAKLLNSFAQIYI